MMDKLWTVEKSLWLDGEDCFARHMATEAVIVFAGPAGILKGNALVEGLRAAPRWQSVEMDGREHVLHEACAVLAYRATAQREGGAPYTALCMSVYEDRDSGWRIVAHQQTPV